MILGSELGRNVYKKQLVGLVQQYNLNTIVKFIDAVDEMPTAYKIANLVCSTSIEPEAFGRVAVESQAMEIPILASNIGGSKETIINNKTGFFFESGNSKDLAEKIFMIMQIDYNSLKFI